MEKLKDKDPEAVDSAYPDTLPATKPGIDEGPGFQDQCWSVSYFVIVFSQDINVIIT